VAVNGQHTGSGAGIGVLANSVGAGGFGLKATGYQAVHATGTSPAFSNLGAVTALNTAGGYALYGESTYDGTYSRATGTSGVTYGVYGEAVNSTSGYGLYGTGGLYGAYGLAGSGSSTTYGVYGESQAVNGRGVTAKAPYMNFYSDPASGPLYGLFHQDTSPVSGGIGVYSYEYCTNCYAGYFNNSSGTAGSGSAIYLNGRIKIVANTGAGTFTASGVYPLASYTYNTSYVNTSSLVILTPRTLNSSTACVTSVANGSFTVSFSPALGAAVSYTYLIIQQ